MKPLLMALLALFLHHAPQAQELRFGAPADSASRLAKSQHKWVMEKGKPKPILIQYHAPDSLRDAKGYFFIDRKTHLGTFEEQQTDKVWLSGCTWASKVVAIEEAGDLLVGYANARKEVLAQDTLQVRYDKEVFFCQEVHRDGRPVGIRQSFQSTPTGLVYFYMYMQSQSPFDTHQLITKIFRFDAGDYRTPISVSTDYVNPNWRQVAFRGPIFTKPGQYRVEVSKANGEPFATTFLTILPPDAEAAE